MFLDFGVGGLRKIDPITSQVTIFRYRSYTTEEYQHSSEPKRENLLHMARGPTFENCL